MALRSAAAPWPRPCGRPHEIRGVGRAAKDTEGSGPPRSGRGGSFRACPEADPAKADRGEATNLSARQPAHDCIATALPLHTIRQTMPSMVYCSSVCLCCAACTTECSGPCSTESGESGGGIPRRIPRKAAEVKLPACAQADTAPSCHHFWSRAFLWKRS